MDESVVVVTPHSVHPAVAFLRAVWIVTLYLLALIRTLVTFSTVYVPRFIYTVVTYSFTLQLTFPYLVTIFVLLLLTISVSLHYFYFAKYRNLKEEPLQKGDAKELHPDVVSDTPPNFHSYLDEFLQAVRVFGFLERNVFHELARHLQTRRLIAGDTISLDSDHSFYAVIDGLVQVYAQQGTSSSGHDTGGALDDDGDLNGYQLLNEVSSGGTISSLFTILSLFTEDVPISWPEPQDEDDDQSLALALAPNRQTVSPLSLSIGTQGQGTDTDIPRFSLARRDTSSTSGSAEPSEADAATVTELDEPRVRIRPPSMSSGRATPPKWPDYRRSSSLPHDVRHGTVARAATDTTLAVIPAEAFRRLTKNFPKASAHIVQVILTRFSRVTFNVAHKYLGLTTELLRTEKVINDLACHPLPATFYEGGGMQRLRQRFAPELDTDKSSSTETDYFAYDPVASPTARNTPFLRTMPALATTKIADRVSSAPTISFKAPQTPAFPARASLSQVGAGDLFSMTRPAPEYSGLSRTASGTATPFLGPRRRGKSDTSTSPSIDLAALTMDDFDLREEVMTCLARSIGLQQPGPSGSESAEPSPAVSPATNGLGAYGSPLGPLTALGMPGVDDASSVTGQSAANMSLGAAGVVENAVEILYFSAGSTLVHAGERNAGLFFVIDGFLECFLPVEDWERDKTANMTAANGEAGMKPFLTAQPQADPRLNKGFMPGKKKRSMSSKYLFTVKRGEIAGYLSAMSGIPSYIDIRAKTDVYVGFLPAHALERLLERRPIVLLTLAKRLISLLSPLVLHIDSALDWMQVNSGQIIWREGDASDSFYIVINGRLRELDDKMGDDVEILAEYGQGDYVGELDVITGSPRNTTLHAIRDTELIRMPLTLFNAISARHPQATVQLLRMIASRNKAESRPHTIGVGHAPSLGMAHELAKNNMNLKTVGILPVSKDIPITTFAKKLQAALESIGAPTSYLDQNVVTTHLGRHAFTRVGKLKLAGWFADQEQRYRIVLYVADTPVSSPWTQTCIRQADCVLMVGFGDEPSVGEYERVVLSTKTTARKELVLLHPERTVTPGSTREWLKNRSWVHMHHHVELPGLVVPVLQTPIVPPKDNDAKAMAAFRMLKETVQSGIQRYRHLGYGYKPRPTRPDHTTDFARLARRLCGKSVGIVLGGGGARGLAHLGALRALEEQGVPIDLIGGTSIGSFIGGLYAREGDLFSSGGRAKWFSARMTNVWRILSDVTWPVIAYTTGHEFNRAIYKCFYDVHIEDMWIPFFCNTVSLNWSRIEIHDTGYAWRYIRASMTLVGLLPPLSDHGNMLVDGGYIDNLPVSTMLQKGANIVFAVDVGGVADTSPRFFGDSISGWWILLNRWNPFSESRKIPPITEIQGRLAYVSSVRYLAEAKHLPGCMYMPLPVQQYGIMDFAKFGEIQKIGLVGAREMLKLWGEQDKLPIPRADEDSKGGEEKRGKKGKRERRNSI